MACIRHSINRHGVGAPALEFDHEEFAITQLALGQKFFDRTSDSGSIPRVTRFIVPRRLWLAFFWGAAFALILGFRFEMDYGDRLKRLPSLVDERGHIASLTTAMSAMDSYEQAMHVRKYGFESLGVGVLLCGCASVTKPARGEAYAA